MHHHAYLVFAASYDAVPATLLPDTREPEITRYTSDQLSIAEVRRIQEAVALFPTDTAVRRFVIETDSIEVHAQHALLKVLEEPVSSSQFVIVLRQRTPLLDTLYSRVSFLGEYDLATDDELSIDTFLTATYSERMRLITEWAKRYKTPQLRTFLHALVRRVTDARVMQQTQSLHTAVLQSQANGASLKMLLEDTALILPVEKR